MNNRAFLVAIGCLLLGIAVSILIGTRLPPRVVATQLERLPAVIDDYRGVDDSYGEAIYAILGADLNLYRHYRSSSGAAIDLYIGYYGTAKGGRSAHNPNACLPGAGWAIISNRMADLEPKGAGTKPIRAMVAARDGRYVALYHWYQVNKTEVSGSGIRQNLLRFKNRLLHNRDDGAFVQISVFTEAHDLERAKQIGLAFAGKIGRLLPDYWPQEK